MNASTIFPHHLRESAGISPNRTNTFSLTLTNQLMASFSIVFAIVTIILNGLVLTTFFKHSYLRTPFNVYVICLDILDILNALVPMSMAVIHQLYGQWPFSAIACTIGLYLSQLSNTGNRAVHLLIAGNRLWAVTSPVTYRNRHSTRLTLALLILGWSLTTCLVIPELIVTRQSVNHSLSAKDPACAYDRRRYPALHMTFNVILYNAPEVIILMAYPILVVKLRQRARNRLKFQPVLSINARSRAMRGRKSESLSMSEQTSPMEPGMIRHAPDLDREFSRSRSNNRLFAYLVMSVAVCWTPGHVFYAYVGITGDWNVPFFTVQYFLAYANSWLNPILIYIADSQIRKAANELLKCSTG